MNSASLPPGLILVHGNRIERLRGLLVEWMRRHPLAPLERETILVQSNGIAQWLQLALAADPDSDEGGCGIAAALDLSLPSRFLWKAYRAVLGPGNVPEVSPFDEDLLVWRLVRLLPEAMAGEAYAPLQRFLKHDGDRRKRFQLAQRLADLFDQYQVYRADWLEAWANGRDELIDAHGRARPLEPGQRWQADLWRRVIRDIAETHPESGSAGRASVHGRFMEAVARLPEGRPPPGLPRRVIVFGISSLPQQSVEVLAAIGRWCQVLMCVHNPCEHFWADIVADRDLLRMRHIRHARRPGMPE
ncbi:MAG: exodeoxyribonuclease subunit gamma, partial [Pseudomonadota bacterium]